MIKKKQSNYLITAISLILAGAIGNIIDSVFYGVIFNDSYHQVATAFADQPYGTWFHGEVVDMLYFPFWEGNLPEWLPIWGGKHFSFFNAMGVFFQIEKTKNSLQFIHLGINSWTYYFFFTSDAKIPKISQPLVQINI